MKTLLGALLLLVLLAGSITACGGSNEYECSHHPDHVELAGCPDSSTRTPVRTTTTRTSLPQTKSTTTTTVPPRTSTTTETTTIISSIAPTITIPGGPTITLVPGGTAQAQPSTQTQTTVATERPQASVLTAREMGQCTVAQETVAMGSTGNAAYRSPTLVQSGRNGGPELQFASPPAQMFSEMYIVATDGTYGTGTGSAKVGTGSGQSLDFDIDPTGGHAVEYIEFC